VWLARKSFCAEETGQMLNELETPCLLLDEMRLRRNIRRLRERLAHLGVAFRPHLKSAKSIEVARLAMTSPGGPATVSTLREADYFAENGVTDMIYGVGIAPAKLPRVSALRGRGVDLAVILDSLEQAEAVAAFGLEKRDCIPALIELDADGHRGGISPGDTQTLLAIARCLERAGSFRGVLSHAGGAYDLSDESDLVAAALVERDTAVAAANLLRAEGLSCPVVSVGSTPTALFATDLTGVTEVRAGVFMFGDLYQVGVGTIRVEEVALSVLASVIGHNRSKGFTIIDAGWTALSNDRGTASQAIDQGYGLVCDLAGRPYTDLIVSKVSQEHGVLTLRRGSDASPPQFSIGTRVRILPNHACATGAQHDRYRVLDQSGRVSAVWPRISGW
jgi:D-serine deaminase-like pyridoxal phosphate-dependent protein